jgi:hypothetical protein
LTTSLIISFGEIFRRGIMESKGMNLLEALGKHDRISPKEASRNVREWISTQIFHTYNYHCIAKKKKRGGGGGGKKTNQNFHYCEGQEWHLVSPSS